MWSVSLANDRAQITQLLGFLVSVIGVILASPSGAAWAAKSTIRTLTTWRSGRPVAHEASGTVLAASATIGASGVVSSQRPLTVDERLDLLDSRIAAVQQRVTATAERLDAEISILTAALEDTESKHSRRLNDLSARITVAQADAAKVDGRALPVVLIGLVLGSADRFLGALPIWFWAAINGAALVVSTVIVVRVWQAHCVSRRAAV